MAQPDGVPQGLGVWVINSAGGAGGVTPVSPGGAPAGFYSSLQAEANVALAAGDTVVVAAVAGKQVYVTGYIYGLGAATTAKFTSNPAGTPISGPFAGVQGANEATGGAEPFLFRTAAGQSLVLNILAGNGVAQVRYRQF